MQEDIENKLSSELQGKRLICEVDFNEKEFKAWLEIIIPKGIHSWEAHPALSAVITTATGIYQYEGGDFWSAFSDWHGGNINQTEWGKRFNEFIGNHDTLESFQDLDGHKYVARILAHGGVPRYCLPDFFKLLVSLGDPEQPGSEFIENINETSLTHIDKPVQRFLLNGGEVAEEFVARCLSLWLSHESGNSGTYGLPKRVTVAFSDWYTEHQPNTRSGRRFPKPQVRMIPQDLWVHLHLPRCDDHPEIDQNTCWEAIDKEWAVSREQDVPLTLRNNWVVRCNDHKFDLKGIDDSEPVMFFDPDNGKVIPNPGVRRLPEYLWAVLEQSLIVEPAPVSREEVPGWQSYVFIELDLAGQQYVKVGEKCYAVRRPFFHIDHAPIVKGVMGENKLPVYYKPPNINWKGKANFGLIQDGKNEGNIDITSDEFKIWFDRPGSYKFHLRGPLGQNVHKEFIMIPCLELDIRPTIMWPDTPFLECGITSDQVEIRDLDGQAPPFKKYCSSFIFKALWDGKEEKLIVAVPSLQWRALTAVGEVPDWGNEPIKLSIHDLETADYPRLVCKIDPMTIDVSVTLNAEYDPTKTPQNQQNSSARKQNVWSFDLRMVRDQIRQSGKAEKFEISVRATDDPVPYHKTILTVSPEWDLQDFRAELKKQDTTSSICMTWRENANDPVVSGRWFILIPLWRPWEGAIQTHLLCEEERCSLQWHFTNIRPGRYVVRAVHAPWGHDNWCEAEYLAQEKLDINMGDLSAIFECGNDFEKTVETYCEHLLAHWYRPQVLKQAPDPPLALTHEQIRDFLHFLQQADALSSWLRIPSDGSGFPSIFYMNSMATTDAVASMQELPDIGSKVLPSCKIISLNLGEYDKKFIRDVVFQYTILDPSSPAVKSVKNKNKRKHLSAPMQKWHRNLSKEKPPLDGIFFLCEKFDLCIEGIYKNAYEEIKRICQLKRPAV